MSGETVMLLLCILTGNFLTLVEMKVFGGRVMLGYIRFLSKNAQIVLIVLYSYFNP